jgi:acyl dehydratase
MAATPRAGEAVTTPLAESLAYEDVDLAATYLTRPHTITDGDIATFSTLTHDHHPLHTDDAFARGMGFDRRIAHGLFGLSLMEGLKAELGLYTTTSVASLGWDDVRFRVPIYVGDTVQTRVSFVEKRPSRRPGRGVVVEQVDLINQDGVAVITARHASLLVTAAAAG